MRTTQSSRRSLLWRLLALLLVGSLAAAACGNDDGGDEESTTTTEATDDGDTGEDDGDTGEDDGEDDGEAASDIDPDGVVRVGYDLVSESRGGVLPDPIEGASTISDDGLYYFIYGSLLRRTVDDELVPDLAESVEVTDANTIVVTVREGLTFSDGSPFDGAAVAAGLQRSIDSGNDVGFFPEFFAAESATADGNTVTISVPDGTAQNWHDSFMGSWETSIVKGEVDEFGLQIGAGPYAVTAFAPEASMTLERRDDFWNAEAVLIKGIEITHMATDDAVLAALGADQVDYAALTDATKASGLSGGDESLFEVNPNTISHLMICKDDSPLGDPLVRKAINKAIDRETISEALFNGDFLVAHGLWPEGHPFHDPAVEENVSYDPDAARDLLAEAGYADGEVTFDLYVLAASGMPEIAEVLQAMWSEVGIEATLVPSPDYVNEFLVANPGGMGIVPVMSDNRGKLGQWTGESIGNTCGYSNPDLDALVTELNTLSDDEPRTAEIWHEVEAIVTDEALSGLLLFGGQTVGYDPAVVGNASRQNQTLPMIDVYESYVIAG